METTEWVIASAAGLISALAAVAAWVLSRKAALYANFDELYQNVLDTAIDKPALRDPATTRNYEKLEPNDRSMYESYAYMVFNVCETIADSLDFYRRRKRSLVEFVENLFCLVLPTIADRKWLRKTWLPVLVAEKELHATWLGNQECGKRFKQEFLTLMANIEKVRP